MGSAKSCQKKHKKETKEKRFTGRASSQKHFVGCILEDKEPRVTGEDGAKAMVLMSAVFKAMETGGWVDLPLKGECSINIFDKMEDSFLASPVEKNYG